MALDKSEGISTGMAIGIGVGCLLLGGIGTAAVYEMVVIPNALEVAKATSGANKTTAAK